MRHPWILLLIGAFMAPSASALSRGMQPPDKESLEEAVRVSPLIIHASIKWVQPTDMFDLTIIGPMRGPATTGRTVRTLSRNFRNIYINAMTQDHEVIAFLSPYEELAGEWQIDQLIILDLPGGPVDLSSKTIQTIDGTVLTSPKQVLAATRDAIAFSSPGTPTHVNWTGSTPDLIVPSDSRLEAAARKWIVSGDLVQRTEAARCIAPFKSEQNIALLKTLLADPGTRAERIHVPVTTFPVRRAAWLTLRGWGVNVPQPVVESPHWVWQWALPYPSKFVGALVIMLFPPIAWSVLRWLRIRAGRFVEKWSWVRLGFSLIVLCSTLLAAGSADGWVIATRSSFHVEVDQERSYAMIDFQEHRLQVTRDIASRVQICKVEWGSGVQGRIFSGTATTWAIFGIRYYDGGSVQGISIPTIYLLLLTLFLPCIWLMRQRRFARRRYRADHGHCLCCGYDLRHSPDRCPECGRSPLWTAKENSPATPSVSS